MRKNQDHYFRKAKKQGYVARSVYKLAEINQKQKIIRIGDRVIDLGCFPGSWMQYITKSVGNAGIVVGIDSKELKMSLKGNMYFLKIDIHELDFDILGRFADQFDVVCSDMAPKTTGIKSIDAENSYRLCQTAHLVARQWLKKGGNVVVKIFQGALLEGFVKDLTEDFKTVKRFKPKSSRKESKEIFVIGTGKKSNPRNL